MEMLMSRQKVLPAGEAGGAASASLLLVLLHQKRFSADWSKARRKKTAAFISFQPRFPLTAVSRPLPERFTGLTMQKCMSCSHSELNCSSYLVFICFFAGEQLSLLLRHPDQPPDSKVLKVAIIGAPNVGKSTLSNQLLGRKVCLSLICLTVRRASLQSPSGRSFLMQGRSLLKTWLWGLKKS